jgi:EAL and modified HD-GYP domain-containing signal transduction protein
VNRYDKVGSESATTAQERTGGGAQLAPVDPTAAPVDPTVARVARQPILDRDSRLIGYELLFRARQADTAGVLDDREATSAVILDGMVDVGLSDLVGKNLAFLNVSRDFLLSVRPLPLPAHQVVLELLEDQLVDDALLEVLADLVAEGFTIALDDFRVTPETELLLKYAGIVKVDVLEHTGQALEGLVAHLQAGRPGLTLLAEKVETREDFEHCRELGFQAFQGYFFARPSRVPQQRLPSQGFASLKAMADLSTTADFEELERIITHDAGLSMRLLRYANSAYLCLPRRVASIHEGLTWLGVTTVRRFALMVALAGTRDVPSELLVTALVRARMCQMLTGEGAAGDSYFTVGLFSVADALANVPMEEVIEQLPFREDIVEALLHGSGSFGELLAWVISYQRGDFAAAGELIRRRSDVERIYREAIKWADGNAVELV